MGMMAGALLGNMVDRGRLSHQLVSATRGPSPLRCPSCLSPANMLRHQRVPDSCYGFASWPRLPSSLAASAAPLAGRRAWTASRRRVGCSQADRSEPLACHPSILPQPTLACDKPVDIHQIQLMI
jgi:hypothetical protein